MGEWTRTIDGTKGGTLSVTEPTSPLYGAKLVITPGAYSGSRTFTIREAAANTLPDGAVRLGASISIEPVQFSAAEAIILEIPFSRQTAMKAGQRALALFHHDKGRVEIPEGPIAIPDIGDQTPVSTGTSSIVANVGAVVAPDRLWRIKLPIGPGGTVNGGTFTVAGTH